jgi:hypothetical protein
MSLPDYRIFVDDSGNVDPKTTNDPLLRYGSITGVVFKRDHLESVFEPNFNRLVADHFGLIDGKPPLLHRRVLVKPPPTGPFAVLNDEKKRMRWDADCYDLIHETDYSVVTVCVDKVAFYYNNPNWRGDFYSVLVENVIERGYYLLRHVGTADVIVEQKSQRDLGIKQGFSRAMREGFRFISADRLGSVYTSKEINIEPKKAGYPGLQFADLLAAPAFAQCFMLHADRRAIPSGLHGRIATHLENVKFYRDHNGNPKGYGRVWRK